MSMAFSYQNNYQPFPVDTDNEDNGNAESGLLIHVVPENSKARWNHIEDLDSFFARIYHYHQQHGFTCMMLQEFLELVQFVFIVVFSTFLLQCVDYPVLFRNSLPNNINTTHKITLSDVVIDGQTCIASFGPALWICLLVAFVFWILRLIRVIYHCFQYWEIRSFYRTALRISDSDLDNLTWHDIQQKVRDVQRDQQMCIHKQDLTELDIYHRILRFKNYMVALVNKSVLPLKFELPLIGEIVFLSRGLKYNLEILLFCRNFVFCYGEEIRGLFLISFFNKGGPWAPFENNWHLKDDYRRASKRKELADALAKHIFWVGLINLALCPLIVLWQLLYAFYNYVEVIKREPGSLGARRWSMYGRLYLRHFNELDHELYARLNRAHRPATHYMSIFTSHIMTVLAKNIAFIAGAVLAALLLLTVYDEDVLTVEHLLSIMTILGAILAGCRVFIPDENLVWCPETLLEAVLIHVHYLPEQWKGQAHTSKVRTEFAQLFQYKVVYLLEELLSPVVTPLMLCFLIRPKALEIVDFLRNFTVEVVGVGDVCSFAQLDLHRHGNAQLQASVQSDLQSSDSLTPTDERFKAEDGKTELSLVHFALTNPDWRPPPLAESFLAALKSHLHADATQMRLDNPFANAFSPQSSIGAGYQPEVVSLLRPSMGLGGLSLQTSLATPTGANPVIGGLNRTEGPFAPASPLNLQSSGPQALLEQVESRLVRPDRVFPTVVEPAATNMALSVLYLHDLNRRNPRGRGGDRGLWTGPVYESGHRPEPNMPGIQESPEEEDPQAGERRPLLRLAKSS